MPEITVNTKDKSPLKDLQYLSEYLDFIKISMTSYLLVPRHILLIIMLRLWRQDSLNYLMTARKLRLF